MRVAVLLVGLVGCYQPSELGSCTLICNPDNQGSDCPQGQACVADLCTPPGGCSIDDGANSNCLGTGLLTELCAPAGTTDLILEGTFINTDQCATFPNARLRNDPAPHCAIFAPSIQVNGAGLRAIGDLPLVLVSDSTIVVDGTLDVGSHTDARGRGAGGNANCPGTSSPGDPGTISNPNTFGGAGGAGGSCQGSGGSGGNGEKIGAPSAGGVPGMPQPFSLRGGCAGGTGGNDGSDSPSGAGPAGDGGGVIYLVARNTISLTNNGIILANGAGGRGGGQDAGGGGGGGAGGLIVFDTPSILSSGGMPIVCATGGGGGGGAELNTIGRDGQDGCLSIDAMSPGVGGKGGSDNSVEGRGGDGGTTLAGGNGNPSVDGGGGGGGGTGFIRVFNATNPENLGLNVSPAPITPGGG